MTLVSYPGGNPKLAAYAGDKLTYTFGRLAGLSTSVDGYGANLSVFNAGCVPTTISNVPGEFGQSSLCGPFPQQQGICDWPTPQGDCTWHGFCGGGCYRPGSASETFYFAANLMGFRPYIGP